MNAPKVWMTLGFDPVTETLYVLGFGDSSKDELLREARNRASDDCEIIAVELSDNLGPELVDFLTRCKVPETERHKLIRKLGTEIGSMASDSSARVGVNPVQRATRNRGDAIGRDPNACVDIGD